MHNTLLRLGFFLYFFVIACIVNCQAQKEDFYDDSPTYNSAGLIQPDPPEQTVMLANTFWAATNMQDRPWTTCVLPSCDPGGAGQPRSIVNEQVSVKGFDGSMLFGVAGQPFVNALFWQKIGATDAQYFVAELDFYVGQDTAQNAQALEFDIFAFNAPYRYMFGSECVINGKWQLWDELHGHWIDTTRACQISPGWHHLQWFVHRSAGDLSCSGLPCMSYDLLNVDGNYSPFGTTLPAGPIPQGWGNDSGLNIQLDIGPSGHAIYEYVKNISLVEID